MFYVYILYSEKLDRFYVGYSENPELCLADRHNMGRVKATKNGIPYILKSKKSFPSELEAIREERHIKSMKSRKYILELLAGNW
jgi:putative endonuclease